MRIIQVVHSFYPSLGGIENHVYELTKELSEKNEVVVYTTGKERKDEMIGKVLVRRFHAINFPFFSSVNFSPGLFYSLLKERGDIFHSHGFGSLMPLFTAKIAWLKRKPFIFTLHGYPRQRGGLAIFQKFYEIFIGPIFLLLAARIITVSTIIPSQLSGYKKKIEYIPNGVTVKFVCDSSFAQKKSISYIGRLDEEKNISLLVRAFADFRNSDLNLRICGKDEGVKSKLQSMANAWNVKVEFLEVPYDEVQKVYCDSKAIVLPSRYEGFPLIWLESIACGRPIFSTRVGDYEHFFGLLFGKDAERFLFNDEKELVEKLRMFLKDEKAYEKSMIDAREKLLKEFDWKIIAERTEKLYGSAR